MAGISPEKIIRVLVLGGQGYGICTLTGNLFGIADPFLKLRTHEAIEIEVKRQEITFKVCPLPIVLMSGMIGITHTLNSPDVLVYCVRVDLYLRQETLIKSLQDKFGKKIWKKCLVAFTYSNSVWDSIKRRTVNNVEAVAEYKQHINHCANLFQQEMNNLNTGDISVKTSFGLYPTQEDEAVLLAIPAGFKSDDPVLPDASALNWRELLMVEIVRKCSSELLYCYNPEVAAVITAAKQKRQRQRDIYKKMLQEGLSLQIRVVRFNLEGLPRSGKTSFRRRIMGEIVNILAAIARGEREQPSTGVVEAGGQVLIRSKSSTDMGTISSKVWSVLSDLGEEAGMLGQLLYQTIHNNPSINLDTGLGGVMSASHRSSSTPGDTGTSRPEALHHLKQSLQKLLVTRSPPENVPSSPKTAPSEIDDEIDMFRVIHKAMEDADWETVKYLLDDIILLINTDTGGQAEFMDLKTSLVQGPSINFLFSRLVDELDSEFEVYYTNEEGKSTEKEGSIMTTEEVLFQSLSIIAGCSGTFSSDCDETPSGEAMGSNTPRQSNSKVMLLGTFRDKVSQEEFEKKDRLLQEKIKATPFYKKDIIEFASEDQLMFAVDNMSGGQDEIDRIRRKLEKLIKENFEKITIPASWLVLSLHIRSKKLRTITLEECEKLAWKVRISPSELQHVLWFLHHRVGSLLYYPELPALKATVICDIQVVYDSVSNLIKNTFTFDQVGQRVKEQFREKAQFSLKDLERATSSCTDALIPLQKLVQLLEHLGVLTAIPPSPSSGYSPQDVTYFMPCVLRSARASELRVYSCSDSDPAPLMLRYDCGYVPAGMFPSMIVNLVSQNLGSWKMLKKDLRKNRVQFQVGEDCDTVTVISCPRYFEIVISRSEDFQTPTASVCSLVRGVIQSTLSTVTSRVNRQFSMGYKFGFECPTHPGREHLCVLAHEKSRRMQCLQDERETIPLQPQHKVWFSDGYESPNFLSYGWSLPASAHPLLEQQLDWDHEGIDKDLIHIAHHMLGWEEQLCSHLGMTEVDVSNIKDSHSGKPELQRRDALRRWKSNQGLRATYGNLLKVFVKAGHAQCAKAVCDVLREKR